MSGEHPQPAFREADILAEIAYYERRAAAVGFASSAEGRFLRERYLSFAQRRRQLLAAFLDGRPSAWRQYAPASTCGYAHATRRFENMP